MKGIIPILVGLFGLSLALLSCKKDVSEPAERTVGMEYTPLSDSSFWVYRVDSIGFKGDLGSEPDTVNYYIKFESTGKLNPSDPHSRVVDVYRKDTSGKWLLLRSELWRVTPEGFRKSVDNTTTTHLVFPVELFKSWDGNLYNAEREDVYEIVELHRFKSAFANFTDSTLTVEQQRRENQVDTVLRAEVFGKNVGLLERIEINLKKSGGKFRGQKLLYKLDEVVL